MNEQTQAELLAAWLEDPQAPPPDGLDTEVRETLVALRPEVAPAPRVTVEDILSGVTEGPLAVKPAQGMPVGASIAAAPEEAPVAGSSARKRPWWIAFVGIGGASGLVAAAALLLVVGGTLVTQTTADRFEAGPSVPVMQPEGDVASTPARGVDGVAFADTGLQKAKPGGARVAAKPRPRPSPKPVAAARAGDAPAEEPADAVALSDDFDDSVDGLQFGGEAEDLDAERVAETIPELTKTPSDRSLQAAKAEVEEAELEAEPDPEPEPVGTPAASGSGGAAGPRAPLSRPAATPPPAPAPIPMRPDSVSQSAPMMDAPADDAGIANGATAEYEADSEPVMAEESAERPARESRRDWRQRQEERKASKKEKGSASSPDAAPAAPPPPPAQPSGGLGNLSVMARSGVTGATAPEIQQSQQLLASGDARGALDAARAGLQVHTANTPVRQLLFVLEGDALMQLGDLPRAQAAYGNAVDSANAR